MDTLNLHDLRLPEAACFSCGQQLTPVFDGEGLSVMVNAEARVYADVPEASHLVWTCGCHSHTIFWGPPEDLLEALVNLGCRETRSDVPPKGVLELLYRETYNQDLLDREDLITTFRTALCGPAGDQLLALCLDFWKDDRAEPPTSD